jgi:hypothetical protein
LNGILLLLTSLAMKKIFILNFLHKELSFAIFFLVILTKLSSVT